MENDTAALWQQQEKYCGMVRTVLTARYGDKSPKAFIHTYGCQQNVSDGERISGMLCEMGYEMTDTLDDAAIVLYNTCAVREHAEDRVFGNVGALKHYKRRNPDGIIALCGCMMQQQRVADRIRQSFPYVDLVFGTHVIDRLPELIYRTLCGGTRVFDISDNSVTVTEGIPVRRDGSVKGWLPVMYGCDNFCSYCVVPYVRGRERSRRRADVLAEARFLVDSGYKDITLLGQNVNSYGKGLDEPADFSNLLEDINALEGDFLIRFMTSHPKDCTRRLLETMARCDKVAKHLHLPVQSGNDRVLKAMNRHYDRKKYLELISYARELMPELSITSDIIVGFPGETYEEFRDTLSLVKEVGYTSLFTFIYSARPGTPAATMPDPVSREEKGRWFTELTSLQEEIAAARTAGMVGKTYRVLAENVSEKDPQLIEGRTEGNIIIEFKGDPALKGRFCRVEVTSAGSWILKGVLVK